MQKGQISVQTENIFPIIKQFLYSDQEIFLRELVANATDAISKIKAIAAKGEYNGELGKLRIEIKLDPEAKTLTISDRGLGMTEEEVNKYLNQVAFSSAQEFLEKFKDESVIGHFGLGFYSAFMVADTVEVVTKSYKEEGDNVATKWTCHGDPSYTIEKVERDDRGTDIILHISDDASEFIKNERIEELLNKYCRFLPYEIKFGTRTESTWEGEGDDRKELKTEVENIINNPNPIWKKKPAQLKDEDYKNFYRELHPMSPDPLFWIHLNIDFPFNLTGILYFPKLSNSLDNQRNKIQLYSNQVYVTDNVTEIVPEFLTLLHGVIDSPDIPLNVSRSYLQSDQNVKKINGYITKKVADKLAQLFKKDREAYTAKWDEIGVFVKYGMLSEDKFYDKANKIALLKNVDGDYFTLDEYKAKVEGTQKDKNDTHVYIYTNNPTQHDSFITAAKEKGYDILLMDQIIDNHHMQQLESKLDKTTFKRVDADTASQLIETEEHAESVLSDKELAKVTGLFKDRLNLNEHRLQFKPLSPSEHPVLITRPEFMRRMKEMQSMQGLGGMEMPDTFQVVVNTNHPLITGKLLKIRGDEKKDRFVQYLYDLARLNQNLLEGSEMTAFINKSLEFIN